MLSIEYPNESNICCNPTGKSVQEHLSALEEVLRRIMESGLRLRKDKRVFLAPSVVYLGHQIDSEGLHPVAEKV